MSFFPLTVTNCSPSPSPFLFGPLIHLRGTSFKWFFSICFRNDILCVLLWILKANWIIFNKLMSIFFPWISMKRKVRVSFKSGISLIPGNVRECIWKVGEVKETFFENSKLRTSVKISVDTNISDFKMIDSGGKVKNVDWESWKTRKKYPIVS